MVTCSASRRSVGPRARTKNTARNACARAVGAVATGSPNKAAARRAQRRKLGHRSASVAPSLCHGLSCSRTWTAGHSHSPQAISASAITGSEYRSRARSPGGCTVRAARQTLQRKRRTTISHVAGRPVGRRGPHSVRLRVPWPCSVIRPSARYAAAPHAAQWLGRAASTPPSCANQYLTS